MVKNIKKCLQFSLKLMNATMGVVGIAMITFSVLMIRVWQRDSAKGSSDDHYTCALPWFIHVFIGIGIALCGITCFGHFAAHTANHSCLSSVSFFPQTFTISFKIYLLKFKSYA
ncbi:hypothetical protein M9H77_25857 [Catharanthus roseus]|uniref:Uncharacterized protein n=1 Tax=Catharanthus roseus TaxID=4058 RepID=A0ACC0A8X1_CATRO|nr:hypothetical protein M9H77_25857 [Catharanthus roseus]